VRITNYYRLTITITLDLACLNMYDNIVVTFNTKLHYI
jgi:hypothetical protein